MARIKGRHPAAQVIEEEWRYLQKETGGIITDSKPGKPKVLIRNHLGVENRNLNGGAT